MLLLFVARMDSSGEDGVINFPTENISLGGAGCILVSLRLGSQVWAHC